MISLSVVMSRNHIKSINVLYYNYNFEQIVAVDYREIKPTYPSYIIQTVIDSRGDTIASCINNWGVVDTLITSPELVAKIDSLLRTSSFDNNSLPMDARVLCYLEYNGFRKRLIIDEFNQISLNDRRIKKNNQLVFWIKNSIGYYYWFCDQELNAMEELKDNTINRPRIRSRNGRYF